MHNRLSIWRVFPFSSPYVCHGNHFQLFANINFIWNIESRKMRSRKWWSRANHLFVSVAIVIVRNCTWEEIRWTAACVHREIRTKLETHWQWQKRRPRRDDIHLAIDIVNENYTRQCFGRNVLFVIFSFRHSFSSWMLHRVHRRFKPDQKSEREKRAEKLTRDPIHSCSFAFLLFYFTSNLRHNLFVSFAWCRLEKMNLKYLIGRHIVYFGNRK